MKRRADGAGQDLADVIQNVAPELRFTEELLSAGGLKFLGVTFSLYNGLCWSYGKPKAEPALSARSCHSKLLKSGLMNLLLKHALLKLCLHHIASASQIR